VTKEVLAYWERMTMEKFLRCLLSPANGLQTHSADNEAQKRKKKKKRVESFCFLKKRCLDDA